MEIIVVIKKPCTSVHCDDDHLPPPTPPPPSSNRSLSPFLILMFCGLAVSLSFICYLTLSRRYRRRHRNSGNTDETHEDFIDEDVGTVVHHPIWLINTIGLQQSQIESIHVFKYKRDERSIEEGTDCSVCLSEFEDDESLRLLPQCSHAFHVPCIDTWLRSHKNCPLCRAPIVENTSAQTDNHTIDSNTIEPSTREETASRDSESVDHDHVVEVEDDGEVVKTCGILDETSSGVRVHHSDLGDHDHREQGGELVAIRRSVSMDECGG